MERPTVDNTQALYQAGDTVAVYLTQAIASIDHRLGEGYAAAHPELIAECVRCQTLDYNNTSNAAAIYRLGDQVSEIAAAIHDLATCVEQK